MCVPIAVPGLRKTLRAGGAVLLLTATGLMGWWWL